MGNLFKCPSKQTKPRRAQLAAVSWDSRQTSLSPSQFLRRQQVLQLYRKILRAIREVPAEADRRYLKDWAREEFRRNKDATEEDAIRMMITQGNMQLQELQRTLKLAKS
ncbi:PREDICTED: LYR motif-containing protein 2 [Tauraco erythrolophus]|nr:PREDICTED: LYR motif-containing protein 2 [Tauraco erythrolophus]